MSRVVSVWVPCYDWSTVRLSTLYPVLRSPAHQIAAFVTLFRSIHPGKHGTEEIRFRLRLLRFTTLFSSRFTSVPIKLSVRSVKELQAQGYKRHQVIEGAVDYSADSTDVDNANGLVKTTAHATTGDRGSTNFYQPAGSVSLLDTLPSFMALSATQSALQALPVSNVCR